MTHAFFADMGGFFLETPDFSQGVPMLNAELHYLVKNGHVDLPAITKEEINAKSQRDTLSK